jgi:hypothetical protein
MSVQILSRRSSVLRDRPFPTRLGDGELAINTNTAEPGLFFKDSGSGSAGQPTSPVDGQLHYDTTASNLLMYDATAAAWVTL